MSLRSWISAVVLLSLGVSMGLVLGVVFDLPSLLLNWARGPVQTVELVPIEEPGSLEEDLAEYRALQQERREEPPTADAAAVPIPLQTTGSAPPVGPEQIAPSLVPEPKRLAQASEIVPQVASSALSPPAPEPQADDLIRALAQERARAAPSGAAATRVNLGRVVQIGAYSDLRTATRVIERLRSQGLDAYLSGQRAAGRYPLRVRVRPLALGSARELSRQLEALGFDVWITEE